MSNIKLYDTMTFSEVYGSASEFLTAVKGCPLMEVSTGVYLLKDSSINNLFYLLYARYGNSPIANADVNQFKYKVYSKNGQSLHNDCLFLCSVNSKD